MCLDQSNLIIIIQYTFLFIIFAIPMKLLLSQLTCLKSSFHHHFILFKWNLFYHFYYQGLNIIAIVYFHCFTLFFIDLFFTFYLYFVENLFFCIGLTNLHEYFLITLYLGRLKYNEETLSTHHHQIIYV